MLKTLFRRPAICALGAIALALSACASAHIESDQQIGAAPAVRPDMVYVEDFDLQAGATRSESLLAGLPLHRLREQSQAQGLVAVMSKAILADLAKKGIQAERLQSGAPLPPRGWLVRGAFTSVDEGNRARRALVGFGAGRADVQVAVRIDDLATGAPPAPLYAVQADARSGRAPGAVITMNPYAAALKFVLAGHDLSSETKHGAEKIADQVVAHIKAAA